MKIFLSYKQTWIYKQELTKDLNYIKNIIENTWNDVYIYYLDKKEVKKPKNIINKVKQEIEKSDLVIWFINYSKKSEWELLELWIAEWLDKKILLLINNEYKNDYYLIYWLNTEVLYYENIEEINGLLTNYLKWK